MQLNFSTVSELSMPGAKWKTQFDYYWPSYRAWLLQSNLNNAPDLLTSQKALKKYMPKMWPTYVQLCALTNGDELAARFLTGFQPPSYVSACAQAVIKTDKIQLVRNYDYHPNLLEGTLLLSKWNGKKVIATSDCLIGAVDGMNENGLCVSLTFGGRKVEGFGFGISFILRYVLEFCDTTSEAVKVLKKIPSHMSYNVTVVDKTGVIKTVMLAPDRAPLVTNDPFATNHQGTVDWHENAHFNQTIVRSNFIGNFIHSKNISAKELEIAFLYPPLYNSKFSEGFGTLFTAVYQPTELVVKWLWPHVAIVRSFDFFEEEVVTITYQNSAPTFQPSLDEDFERLPLPVFNWQEAVVNSLVDAIEGEKTKLKQHELRDRLMPNGEIAWNELVNYWNEPYA